VDTKYDAIVNSFAPTNNNEKQQHTHTHTRNTTTQQLRRTTTTTHSRQQSQASYIFASYDYNSSSITTHTTKLIFYAPDKHSSHPVHAVFFVIVFYVIFFVSILSEWRIAVALFVNKRTSHWLTLNQQQCVNIFPRLKVEGTYFQSPSQRVASSNVSTTIVTLAALDWLLMCSIVSPFNQTF